MTYKLKLNGGDIKAVQGDSGHSQVDMVTDVYSHIIDEDRRRNAELFEEAFYEKKNLLDLIAISDLYVHAADMEIEAMSCMEAFAAGLVPVISNSSKSATPQFALDERSLFRAGDSSDLAKKIDYWIEHEDEKKKMEYEYSSAARKYSLDDCVRQAEEMFSKAARL